jgi:hypothetical protein
MIYYKKFDIPGHKQLSKEGLDFVSKRPEIYNRLRRINLMRVNLEEAKKELPSLEIFKYLDLEVKNVYFYVMYTNSNTVIHTDDWPTDARINLPVLNCEGSKLQFWSGVEYVEFTNAAGYKMHISNGKTGSIQAETEIDMPTVIRVNEPHNVVMGPKSPRITLSVDFTVCPSFLLK